MSHPPDQAVAAVEPADTAEATIDDVRRRIAAGEPLVGSLLTHFFRAVHTVDPSAVEDSLAPLPGNRGIHLYDNLVAWASMVAGERVLDVGTGSGGAARAAARVVGPTGWVAAVDPVQEALDLAAERTPPEMSITYRRGGVESMPYLEDRSLDCAVASLVFEELPDLGRALGEMFRVLRPGGRLVGSVMAFDRLRPMDAAFMGAVIGVVGRHAPGGLAGRASRASIPDEPQDKRAFADTGFLTVEEQDVQLALVMQDVDDAWRVFSRTHLAHMLDEEGREDLRASIARRLPHTLYLPVRFLRTRRPG